MDIAIYCHLDEIRNLKNKPQTNGFNAHMGLAFEKTNEGVYHLHIESPKVIPAGIPLPTLICDLTGKKWCKKTWMETVTTTPFNFKGSFCDPKLYILYTENGQDASTSTSSHSTTYRAIGFVINSDSTIQKAKVEFIPGADELYSRSKGILEHSILEKSKVTIAGIGSFGSYAAIELAKAGVGNFNLVDFDRLELANISRHQCGIDDLGRFKTKAVADLIIGKNPYAKVNTYEIDVNEKADLFERLVQDSDLILCMTDENQSRSRINSLGLELNKTVIFGRAITRAEGGDVFVLHGSDKTKPCLACLIGMGLFNYEENEVTQFNKARNEAPAYVDDKDVEATIQVGLASDIAPITNMIVKLSLLELSKCKESGLQSLYEDIEGQYYFWVNRRERKYKDWKPMRFFAKNLSVLRWYGMKISKDNACISCNAENYSETVG